MRISSIACITVLFTSSACGDTVGNPIAAADPNADPGGPNAGTDGGATADGGGVTGPARDPMLAVASSTGVHVWRNATTIAADGPADVTIPGDATAIAATPTQLYFAENDALGRFPIRRFDNPHAIAAGAAPSATTHRTQRIRNLVPAPNDRLFAILAPWEIQTYVGASTFTGTTVPVVTYAHQWQQTPSVAYDPVSDRVFAGQISGAGSLAWNQASMKTGMATHDFQLDDGAYWWMQIEGDRLYALGRQAASSPSPTQGISIWNGVSSLAGPAAPPIKVSTSYTIFSFVSHFVVRDDVLVVADADQDRVQIYKNASAITGDRAPDFTITHPTLDRPFKVALDHRGRLYVKDDDGVLVFRDVTSAPTFIAELKTGLGVPADLTLVE